MTNKDDNSTENEQDLFIEAMSDVQRLESDSADPFRKKRRPVPLNLPVGDEDDDEFADLSIQTHDFLDFCRPGIQKRVYQDLQRGVIEPQASVDLHGMRVAEARPVLAQFLKQSLQAGRRCVRIIHGKGRGSQEQQPILKQKTNQWLRQKEEVLAFTSTPRWDGGTGATYVLLSRKHRLDI